MTTGNNGISCGVGCWALAAGAGFLAFVLFLVLGDQRFFAALFMSGVIFVVLGLLFSSIFCRKLPAPGEVKPGEDRGMRAMPPSDGGSSHGSAPTAPNAPIAEAPGAAAADSRPEVNTASATADAEAGAAVKPTKSLSGSAELASRKGEWKYTGDAAESDQENKPETLSAPKDGTADDLKKIKGVGPKLEGILHDMGFYHFSQIAAWSDKEVAWVDQNLDGFKGRVSRDNWVAQARDLASGNS